MGNETEEEKKDADAWGRVILQLQRELVWGRKNILVVVLGAYAVGGGSTSGCTMLANRAQLREKLDTLQTLTMALTVKQETTNTNVKELRGAFLELKGGQAAMDRYLKKREEFRRQRERYGDPRSEADNTRTPLILTRSHK